MAWPGWPACALVQWLTIPLTILLLHAKATKQSKVNPATMFFLQMDKCYFTVGSGGCQNNHQRRAVLWGQNVVEELDRGRRGVLQEYVYEILHPSPRTKFSTSQDIVFMQSTKCITHPASDNYVEPWPKGL